MSILVSVVIPTKNSDKYIEKCLLSIKKQSYKNIEIIVVDNFSNDKTPEIAKRYTDLFFQQGPERSEQVNFGVEKAKGEWIYKVDSDFVLDPTVIEECVSQVEQDDCDAVVVHNSPDVSVSWIARVRKFEVDMYKFDLTHSSARFVRKSVYQKIGGFNPAITAGEDYDFQNKLNKGHYKTCYIHAEALHLGEPKALIPHMKKYFDYGRDFVYYYQENKSESTKQLGFLRAVYLKHWKSFLRHPILALLFIFYSSLKFIAGGSGFLVGWIQKKYV